MSASPSPFRVDQTRLLQERQVLGQSLSRQACCVKVHQSNLKLKQSLAIALGQLVDYAASRWIGYGLERLGLDPRQLQYRARSYQATLSLHDSTLSPEAHA